MIENASGLILRTRPLTDTSLIVHWLTPEHGRIGTVAKGARRPKSPFAGKLDIFYEGDFSFQRSRRSELHLLREVTLRDTHGGLRRDLDALRQAAYCAALVEQTTETDSPVPEIYSLMKRFVKLVEGASEEPKMLFAFELKLLNELGLQPDLEKEKIGPDLRQILRAMTENEWPVLSRLKLTPAQVKGVDLFVRGFMEFHLGKVPKNRDAALRVS